MFKYGFYNSSNPASPDRVYSSEDFGEVIGSFVDDGIFITYGASFSPSLEAASHKIKIGSGKAWLNNTWCFNTDIEELTEATLPASGKYICHAVVIKIDKGVRTNSISIVSGAEASSLLAAWGTLATALEANITDVATQFQYVLCVDQLTQSSGSYSHTLKNMIDADIDDLSYTGYKKIFNEGWNINTVNPRVQTTGIGIDDVEFTAGNKFRKVGWYGGLELSAVTGKVRLVVPQTHDELMYDGITKGTSGATILYRAVGDSDSVSSSEETTISDEFLRRLPVDSAQAYTCLFEDHTSHSHDGYIEYTCRISSSMARAILAKNGDYYPRKITLSYSTMNASLVLGYQEDKIYYQHLTGGTYSYIVRSALFYSVGEIANRANTSGTASVTLNKQPAYLELKIRRDTTSDIPISVSENSSFIELEW